MTNMDVSNVEAVIPVHFNGYPDSIIELLKLKEKHDFFIVEDAAQSFGSRIKTDAWHHLGTLGDIGICSFNKTKVLSCVQGGLIITKNQLISQKVHSLLNRGSYDHHEIPGYNTILDDLRASIALANLKEFSTYQAKWINRLKR